MRIEFSSSSNNIKYKFSYYKNNSIDYSEINYIEEETYGKKIIDIYLEKEYDEVMFEIYTEEEIDNINKLSYTLRYRTDKENNFINYITNKNIKIIEITKQNNTRKVNISIPALKNNKTSEINSRQYYLKIYKHQAKNLFIYNTISIIDNLEPEQIIEFIINEDYYNQIIDIPADRNKYNIVVKVKTKDKELLGYNSTIIENENNEEGNEERKEGGGGKKDERTKKDEGLPTWGVSFIVIISIAVSLVIIFFIARFFRKKKKKKDELTGSRLLPLSDANKYY